MINSNANLLSSVDRQTLADEVPRAEALGCLTDVQLDLIYKHQLFSLFVPTVWGGKGLDLPQALQLQEQLAYVDGSLGWTVTLCSGASWFVGFMQPSTLPTVFADPHVCFGGSGMSTGTAEIIDGGYVITGFWRYATGAPHLTIFTANCMLTQEGKPVLDELGNPLVQSFFFLRDEVEIVEDWQAMGLKATASHSFSVKDLKVSSDRMFVVHPDRTYINDSIFRFPFSTFAEATLGANYVGMFKRIMDEMIHADVQGAQEERRRLEHVVGRFYDAVDKIWNDEARNAEDVDAVGERGRALVRESLASITGLFPCLGMRGADPSAPVNRMWRDIFTASQHMIFR